MYPVYGYLGYIETVVQPTISICKGRWGKMKKKKLSLLVGVGILTTAIVGGTLAWFTSTDEVDNKVTTGSIKHEIIEDFKQGAYNNVLPGDKINKDVWVHSTGKSDSLLRVKVITPDSNDITPEFANLNDEESKDKDWTKIGDYYYYNKVLKAHDDKGKHIIHKDGYIEDGSKVSNLAECYTSKLLDSITFNDKAIQNDENTAKELNVIVESETIQTTNNAYKDGWKIEKDSAEDKLIQEILNKK